MSGIIFFFVIVLKLTYYLLSKELEMLLMRYYVLAIALIA